LNGIPILCIQSKSSTTYENIYTENGRVQYLRNQATRIDMDRIPQEWKTAPIVHLGPIANEMDAVVPDGISPSLLGLTPQGWMRGWDSDGLVSPIVWTDSDSVFSRAEIVIISREDVQDDDLLIEHMAGQTKILVVTEGADGAVLYWHGDRRRYRAPLVDEVDATGAGDIFAAAFFARYLNTRDPWEATRFATLLASCSVTRAGLNGIPTPQEIEDAMVVVIQ
jgi:sugar/nucleoside kinase (ribokinase family)